MLCDYLLCVIISDCTGRLLTVAYPSSMHESYVVNNPIKLTCSFGGAVRRHLLDADVPLDGGSVEGIRKGGFTAGFGSQLLLTHIKQQLTLCGLSLSLGFWRGDLRCMAIRLVLHYGPRTPGGDVPCAGTQKVRGTRAGKGV